MSDKFKIRGTGIDTSTITWKTEKELEGFLYIYTEIGANNEYLLKVPESSILIVRSGHQDGLHDSLKSHIDALGKEKCDLLLIDEGQEVIREDVISLYEGRVVRELGIKGNDLEKLKQTWKAMKEKEIDPTYVAVEFCPLEFPLDVIEWANEQNLMIIGLNSFGGYINGPRNIMAFGAPYLLGFAATYADLVILSGRDLVRSKFNKQYLENLEGEDSSPIYGLKRKVSRGIKPLKGAVGTSLKLKNITVPYREPELVLYNKENHILRLGKAPEEFTEEVNDDINAHLKTLHYPEDGDESIAFSRARFSVIYYLSCKYPEYEQEYVKVGYSVFLITLTKAPTVKGKLWWKKQIPGEEKKFYLAMNEGKVRFDEIKDETVENTQKEQPENLINEEYKP